MFLTNGRLMVIVSYHVLWVPTTYVLQYNFFLKKNALLSRGLPQ